MARKPSRSEMGLTLVEMLIVLAIIGVMAGAVAIGLSGSRSGDRSVETEARRLSGRLRLAADDVRLDERPLAFRWDREGYGFGVWDATRRTWRPDRVASFGRHDLPSGMELSAANLPQIVPIAPDGSGPPITVRLESKAATWEIRFDGLDATPVRADGR